jgi:hypothetical protein
MNQLNIKTLITFTIVLFLINIPNISFGMQTHEITTVIAKIKDQYYLFNNSNCHMENLDDKNTLIFVTGNNNNLTMLSENRQQTVTIANIYTATINKKTLNNTPKNSNIVVQQQSTEFSRLCPSIKRNLIASDSAISFQNNNLTEQLRKSLLTKNFNPNNVSIFFIDKDNNIFDVEIAATTWSDYIYTVGIPLILILAAAYYFIKMR